MNAFGKIKKTLDGISGNQSFTLKEQLGYAAGIFGNAMGQDCVGTFSDKFGRDCMGIDGEPLVWVGNASTAAGFAIPPVAGVLLDMPVKGKMSMTKRLIGLMPIPFALSSMLLFVVPPFGRTGMILWALILTVIFNTVDTFYDMSLLTLSLRMTNNPDDRKNFYTFSSFASSLGSMLPGWVVPIFLKAIRGAAEEKWGYFFPALLFCIPGVASMYAPFFTLREKTSLKVNEKKHKTPLNRETLGAIIRNKPLAVIVLACFFETFRQVTYKLLPYVYDNVFDDYAMKPVIDAVSGTLSYLGLAAVPVIGKKIQSRNLLIAGYGYSALLYGIISLFNIGFSVSKIRGLRWLIGILIGLSGMPNSAIGTLRSVRIADSADYMEWHSYKEKGVPIRSDGILCAVSNISNKINALIKINLYNISLNKVGYQSAFADAAGKTVRPVQSERTLKGIFFVFTLFGLLGNLLPALVFASDGFTGKKREKILDELRERRAAQTENIG